MIRRRVLDAQVAVERSLAAAVATPALSQDIVIGLSSPLTGPAATAAEWEKWGVDLAVEEINAAGGVLGRKIEIMQLDNKCNPSEGVNVANKLVEAKVDGDRGLALQLGASRQPCRSSRMQRSR